MSKKINFEDWEIKLYVPVIHWLNKTEEGAQWVTMIRQLDAGNALEAKDEILWATYMYRDDPNPMLTPYESWEARTSARHLWTDIGRVIAGRACGLDCQINRVGLAYRMMLFIIDK